MKTLIILFHIAIISCLTFTIAAQSNIDKAIAEIENNPKADITCSEKRNPKTKKAYKISKVIRFTGEEEFQKVKKAFIKDSQNAIEYTRKDGKMYHLIFRENNCSMEYLLKRDIDDCEWKGQWLITVEIKNTDNYPQKRRNRNITTYQFLNNGNLKYWNGSDTLFLDLSTLRELNNLDFDSLYQLNNLNIYYQNN